MRRRPPIARPTAALAALMAAPAAAQDGLGELEIIGTPSEAGIGFQPAATSLARQIHWLDGMLVIIITLICLLVVGLIGWAGYRYHRARNRESASFTHNSPVEIAWTVVPILILVFIGSFSLPVLLNQQIIPEADVTVKTTGYQWYWGYEYPDYEFEFQSYMIGADQQNMLTDETRAQLQEAGYSEDEFRLATDTAMVVPVDKNVVVQVTGADVIHSWTIPAFGVKQDAVPGRLAELWFRAEREGVYFGQCSELCGISHAYMPITVKVVSEEEYAAWLDRSIDEYGGTRPENDPYVTAQAEDTSGGTAEGAAEGGEAAGGSGSGMSIVEGRPEGGSGQSDDAGGSGSGEDAAGGGEGSGGAAEDTPPASTVQEGTETPSGVGSSSDAVPAEAAGSGAPAAEDAAGSEPEPQPDAGGQGQ